MKSFLNRPLGEVKLEYTQIQIFTLVHSNPSLQRQYLKNTAID